LWLTPYVTNRSGGGRTTGAITGLSGVTAQLAGKGTHLGTATIEYTASSGAFRFKTAHDSYGAAHAFSVANGITTINLRSSTDAVSTTLSGDHTLPDSTIDLTDASSFPSSGTYVVGTPDTTVGGVGEQLVQCTGKSSNQLTGCTGGTGSRLSGQAVKVVSYIVLSLDDANSLPSSGVTEGTFTVSDGRPEGQTRFNDVIFHNTDTPINAPGGYAPP